MAVIYVRSSDGSDADNGSTWALAKVSAAGASAIDVAGDTIAFSSAHSETPGGVTLAFAGTPDSPVLLLSVNDSAAPPTTIAAGAQVRSTLALSLTGSFYAESMHFACGNGAAGNVNLNFGGLTGNDHYCHMRGGVLGIDTTGSSSRINIGSAASSNDQTSVLENVEFDFSNTGQGINVYNRATIRGCSKLSGSSNPTGLFRTIGSVDMGAVAVIENCDFSGFSSSMALIDVARASVSVMVRNCKMPASWTGDLATTLSTGARVEAWNLDIGGSTPYRFWIVDYAGFVWEETLFIRSGGSTDGTTAYSVNLHSSSNSAYPTNPMLGPWMSEPNTSTGSPITLSVELLHESEGGGSGGRYQDNEVALEVQYLGTSGSSQGSHASTRKAILAAPSLTPFADSSETWFTTGLSSPLKQTISVTFTPQEEGEILWRIALYLPSAGVIYCNAATLS